MPLNLTDLLAPRRSYRHYRRAAGPISGAVYTPDHRFYDRVETPRFEIHFLTSVPGVVEYTLRHDRRRCSPFGVFLVYRHHGARTYLVGTSLSRPSLDDCARLSRDHAMRNRRDPTLPEPVIARPTTYVEEIPDE